MGAVQQCHRNSCLIPGGSPVLDRTVILHCRFVWPSSNVFIPFGPTTQRPRDLAFTSSSGRSRAPNLSTPRICPGNRDHLTGRCSTGGIATRVKRWRCELGGNHAPCFEAC